MAWPMVLNVSLVAVPASAAYKDPDGYLSSKVGKLSPEAARNFNAMIAWFQKTYGTTPTFTDVFRSIREQMALKKLKPTLAVQPGDSGHNYGISLDFDIEDTINRVKKASKKPYSLDQLNKDLAQFGWTPIATESWHKNCLGTYKTVKEYIEKTFGQFFVLTTVEAQKSLQELALYVGKIDGDFGPKSQAALKVFQKDYGLTINGALDAKTMKMLALVTMRENIIQIPNGGNV